MPAARCSIFTPLSSRRFNSAWDISPALTIRRAFSMSNALAAAIRSAFDRSAEAIARSALLR